MQSGAAHYEVVDEVLQPMLALYEVYLLRELPDQVLVDDGRHSGYYHEYRVLFQEGEGQPVPVEIVLQIVEVALDVPPHVVEPYHLVF